MNYIDKIRLEIRKDFSEKAFQKSDFETFLSPSKQFCLEATKYLLKEPNWGLTKVEIYNQKTRERLFDLFINDSSFFHEWVTSNKVDYLVCAEDIFGGQTIVDLTNCRIMGYSPNDGDGFIWTEFHLSPDGKTLATVGCYWGCPYVVKFFDFTNPMNLPLNEIREIHLLDNSEIITGWMDNERIEMSLSETKTVREDFADGTCKYKLVSIPIGARREIRINIK